MQKLTCTMILSVHFKYAIKIQLYMYIYILWFLVQKNLKDMMIAKKQLTLYLSKTCHCVLLCLCDVCNSIGSYFVTIYLLH